jgi:hypothetical protein
MIENKIQENHASRFLVMKDNNPCQNVERHRRSQSMATLTQLGSLGLQFDAISDPFADPLLNMQPTLPNLSTPSAALTSTSPTNVAQSPNRSDYISNVRSFT